MCGMLVSWKIWKTVVGGDILIAHIKPLSDSDRALLSIEAKGGQGAATALGGKVVKVVKVQK
jgi:SepF-like predicted cell division protein (DUF552 family)